MLGCKEIGACFGPITEGLRVLGITKNVSKTSLVMTHACIHECIVSSMSKDQTNYAQITEDIHNISKQKDIFLKIDNLNAIERAHTLGNQTFNFGDDEVTEILEAFETNLLSLVMLIELNLIKDNCPTLEVGYQMTMDVVEWYRQVFSKIHKLIIKQVG